MSKSMKTTCITMCLLWLTACNHTIFKPQSQQQMPLLPPALSLQSGIVKQKMTMLAGGKLQTFIVISNYRQQSVETLIMLVTGQTLLSMAYDGQKFHEENKTGLKLPAQEILAIIQFASWPEQVLKDFYKHEDGWEVLIDSGLRRLNYNQTPMLEVQYLAAGIIEVNNLKQHYRANIQALEANQ
jgi:hypothetical protein